MAPGRALFAALAALVGLSLFLTVAAVPRADFFETDSANGGTSLFPGDDTFLPASLGGNAFTFMGGVYDRLFVNTNGCLSFNFPVETYNVEAFPWVHVPVIAPFWADVDTLGMDPNDGLFRKRGTVSFRTITDRAELDRAAAIVERAVPGANFQSDWAFAATWDAVGYFGMTPLNQKYNTFQVIISSDAAGRSYAIFQFLDDGINWTTGTSGFGPDGSWPPPRDGLGGVPANVGFDAGNRQNFYSDPFARTPDVVDIETRSVPAHIAPGQMVFLVSAEDIEVPPDVDPISLTMQCKDVTLDVADGASACASRTITAADVNGGSAYTGPGTLALSLDAAGPFPVGTTQVTLTGDDGQGTTGSCVATVTVVPPPPTCRPEMTVPAVRACAAEQLAPADVYTGICDDALDLSLDNAGPLPLGVHDVTLTARGPDDAVVGSCSTVVTVVDDEELDSSKITCGVGEAATVFPRGGPVSFTASYHGGDESREAGTKQNGCPVTVRAAPVGEDATCQRCNGRGKVVTPHCAVAAVEGAKMVDVLVSGGVDNHISWEVVVSDGAGREVSGHCGVCVRHPRYPNKACTIEWTPGLPLDGRGLLSSAHGRGRAKMLMQ
ncbi:unnamed protein product [Pedinophyceae sp. YPF-701]|nr:unnamed protein product [Pedinophyceae sp. YPF-701]